MNFLFWSQTLVWAFLIGYLVILMKKSKQLEKEVDIIKKDLDKPN